MPLHPRPQFWRKVNQREDLAPCGNAQSDLKIRVPVDPDLRGALNEEGVEQLSQEALEVTTLWGERGGTSQQHQVALAAEFPGPLDIRGATLGPDVDLPP